VLVIPAFAEEMNKSRRMVTETALALVASGFGCVVPDLYGTGDSAGEFEQADWPTWVDDLARAGAWSAGQGDAITGILATRLGAALAAAAVSTGGLPAVAASVLWQPIFDSKRWLTQFLRLRIAAALAEQDRKESMQDLLDNLRAGGVVEVAGYAVPGKLAMELESRSASATLPAQLGAVHWFEVVRDTEAPLSAVAVQLGDNYRAAGNTFESQTFVGEPFWGSTEIVRNVPMITASAAAFSAQAS
jgi:exosortase A-associated hydrolase 2